MRDYGKGDCENIALHYAKKCEGFEKQIVELKAQLEEEYSRGVKEGLCQAADIVKNC